MTALLTVLGEITLEKPCTATTAFPSYGTTDAVPLKFNAKATVFVGSTDYRITVTVRTINLDGCATVSAFGGAPFVDTGAASSGTPYELPIDTAWTGTKPAGNYEIRVSIEAEKSLGGGSYGPKELIALTTCAFKVGSPSVGCAYLRFSRMKPCNTTVTGTYAYDGLSYATVQSNARNDYQGYQTSTLYDVDNDATIRVSVAGRVIKRGETDQPLHQGAADIARDTEYLNQVVAYLLPLTKLGSSSSSSSSTTPDPCTEYGLKLFRCCRYSGS